jgi:hypothetical protein
VIAPYEVNVFEYRSEAGALSRGSEEGLKCLNGIIEPLEPHIVSSIQKLFTEGERIRNKFDNELKRGLKTTIVEIEDGYFAANVITNKIY